MDQAHEDDEFARIRITIKAERAEQIIENYRQGIVFYREKLNDYHHVLGRIAQRLGEPQIEEPS